jgi:hypothetical protein
MRNPASVGFQSSLANCSRLFAPAPFNSGSASGLADPTDRSILVLGSPRSGTTWLAKILDSHPDVLYRHEPDEVRPPSVTADPRQQLRIWINERSARVSATPPLFRKSWQPLPVAMARAGVAQFLRGTTRLSGGVKWLNAVGVPDFVALHRRPNLRVVLKLVNWNASAVLHALPGCRCLFILRHPCGQVASTMAGMAQGRFGGQRGMINPVEEAASASYAATSGTDPAAFQALPVAAKLAWIWRAFNESALAELLDLPNVSLVLYEDLCDRPEAVAQNLFDFIGLRWHSQTVEFIARSTRHEGSSDYYTVFRSTGVVARQWRSTMHAADQEAVRSVVRDSPLARHWDDLCI